MRTALLKRFQIEKMQKHVFEAFSSYLQNEKAPFWTVFQVYHMETTFLKRFQFLKMKKHVFEAFFKYMEATFLNRFSILKDKKSRFSSAFEFTRNEKTSFPIVFKLTKWKNMFSKRFQTYRMKKKRIFELFFKLTLWKSPFWSVF